MIPTYTPRELKAIIDLFSASGPIDKMISEFEEYKPSWRNKANNDDVNYQMLRLAALYKKEAKKLGKRNLNKKERSKVAVRNFKRIGTEYRTKTEYSLEANKFSPLELKLKQDYCGEGSNRIPLLLYRLNCYIYLHQEGMTHYNFNLTFAETDKTGVPYVDAKSKKHMNKVMFSPNREVHAVISGLDTIDARKKLEEISEVSL